LIITRKDINLHISKQKTDFDISSIMVKDTDMMTPKLAQELITNLSYISAWRYIGRVREALGKNNVQIITVKEFRNYYGI